MTRFWQAVVGADRKWVIGIISEITNSQVKYSGVPTFKYEAGGWCIDKENGLFSPSFNAENALEIKEVLTALENAGLQTEGDLVIGLSSEGVDEEYEKKLNSLIEKRSAMISKSFDHPIDSLNISTQNGECVFKMFNATLEYEKVHAYSVFVEKLDALARKLKYCSVKEKQVENEKYAFRCFLLRLGFIGDEYKGPRKVLLKNLEGNSSFKSLEARE
ncbi:MAG: virulence protein [Bacillota bacterium]